MSAPSPTPSASTPEPATYSASENEISTDQWAIALTTAGSEDDAEALAAGLVNARLAACVTILPGRSVYRWQGELQTDKEWQLLIKIRRSHLSAVSHYVRSHHSYDLPELLAIPIIAGSSDYLNWLDQQVSPPPPPTSDSTA